LTICPDSYFKSTRIHSRRWTGLRSRYRHPESIQRVPILLVQWPTYRGVELLHGSVRLLCHMSHDRRHRLALVELLFASDDVLWGDPALRKVDVPCPDRQHSTLNSHASHICLADEPFSLSTRSTTTTSFLPTRTSFCILLIRLRDSSESRIMPSMLSYSRSLTYAPISATCLTFTWGRCQCSGLLLPSVLGQRGRAMLTYHDEGVNLRILVRIEAAICERCRHDGWLAGCGASREVVHDLVAVGDGPYIPKELICSWTWRI